MRHISKKEDWVMSNNILNYMVMRKCNQSSIKNVIERTIVESGHNVNDLFEASFYITLEDKDARPSLVVQAIDFRVKNRKGHC